MNKYEINIINELYKLNYSHDLIASILAQIKVESNNYKIFRENLYYTTMDRLINIFGKRFNKLKLSQDKINKCIKNPEYLANIVYANRMGNNNDGDGWLYRGNGLPQITGKDMHRLVGNMIGVDLVNNPDLLNNDIEINTKVVLAFCDIKNIKKCNTIEEVSRRWNGGNNGLYERQKEFLDERFELFVTEDLSNRNQEFIEYLMKF